MATDPKASVAPNVVGQVLEKEVAEAVAAGLGNLSLRELLSMTLTSVGEAERRAYLARMGATDKGNGSYARGLRLGSIPLEIQVPRTRSGAFRPSVLPSHYERDYPEETQALVLGLLASSRSLNTAKAALRRIGLSGSEQDIEAVAADFIEELSSGTRARSIPICSRSSSTPSTSRCETAIVCGRAASTWPSGLAVMARSAS